ncbi:MAG TPA: hypothetical protein VMQ81_05180, partial [Acidimicrobiia bacterium]|nr:hypothetical protein [Acidimicrobiia bacterium]
WMRWGVWVPALLVWTAGLVTTVALLPSVDRAEHAEPIRRAGHEVSWLMVVYVVVYWGGLFVNRIPLVSRVLITRERARPSGDAALATLPAVDRARAVALWELGRHAGASAPARALLDEAIELSTIRRRARIVGCLAPGRSYGTLATSNAHARAALILLEPDGRHELTAAAAEEAARGRLGMVTSEPGWVTLFDGTLMAAALHLNGDDAAGPRWAYVLDHWFPLIDGRRIDARHAFLGLGRGPIRPWERATASVIAAGLGWVPPEPEWHALRQPTLAAVGRGGRAMIDNRLIAAGRCWTALVDDHDTDSLLRRVSPAPTDPVASALDALAVALHDDPAALRRPASRSSIHPTTGDPTT